MQTFVACLAAVLVVFLLCRCILSCCAPHEYDRGHSRPYRTRNAHAPNTRGSNARTKKSTVKVLRIPDHIRNLSHSNHISPHVGWPHVTTLSHILASEKGKDVTPEDVRKIARDVQREREEALKWANRARRRGDYDAAVGYIQDIKEYTGEMEVLNRYAANAIFIAKNKNRSDGMIDLHGLYVEEALEYAELAFESTALEDDKEVRFIVGKGLHAKDGKAKIRPALEKLCEERGFTYHLHPKNAGVLVVHC